MLSVQPTEDPESEVFTLEFHQLRMNCGHLADAILKVHILDTVDEVENYLHMLMKRECPACIANHSEGIASGA